VREAADALVRDHPGAIIEHKTAGLVLHYRLAPAAGARLHDALARLVADAPYFELMPAAAAWEVRPRGIEKGLAVRTLMQAPPFRARRPVFIGDDVTDEDGIAAAIALGGVGLRVADTFGDAAGVRAWLAQLAADAAR
jgi:trehalose 6-phosphate phosphatase